MAAVKGPCCTRTASDLSRDGSPSFLPSQPAARQPSLRLLPTSSSHDSGAKDVHSICTELKAWLCFLPLLKMLLSVLDTNDFIFSGVVVT